MEFICTSLLVKRILYLLLVVGTVLVLFNSTHAPRHHWLIWSGLALSCMTVSGSFLDRIVMIFLTGILMSLAVFLSGLLVPYVFLIAVYLTLLTMGSIFLSLRYPAYYFSFFLVNLFAIISTVTVPSIKENLDQSIFIILGMSVAILFQCIFWPYFLRNQLRSLMMSCLHSLFMLNKEIFACFLQPEYSDNIYLYERRLHVQKMRFLQAINRFKKMVQLTNKRIAENKEAELDLIAGKLALVFDIIMDYAQLRRRISDHTIFALCRDELTAIAQEIDKVISEINAALAYKNSLLDITDLTIAISRFEETYQQVLQVAAREPLVFMLFISSLKSFCEEITLLYQNAMRVREALR